MKMGCFLLLLIFPALVSAQNLLQIEYYFDTDPGQGKGIQVSISPDSTADLSFSAETLSLENGFHRIFFRAQDDSGRWGLPQSKSFILSSQNPLVKNKIQKLEYFFDSDPGYGLGTTISFPADTLGNRFLVAVPAGLFPGFHRIYFRYQDETGGWSLDHSRGFLLAEQSPLFTANVAGLEYFFDSDPGQGLGHSISVDSDTLISRNLSVNLENLSPGFHAIYFRAKTELGLWGIPVMKPLLVEIITSDSTDHIEIVEFFFDSDPGLGQGETIPVSQSSRLSDSILVDLSGIPNGIHNLGIRVKTSSDSWSFTTHRSFIKQGIQNDNLGVISGIEYFFGDDPGLGKGIPISVSPVNIIDKNVILDLSGLQNGFHLLRIRSSDNQGNWGLLSSRPIWVDQNSGIVSEIERAEWKISKQGSVLTTGVLNATTPSLFADWIADLPLTNSEVDSTYLLELHIVSNSGGRSLASSKLFSIREFNNILISWKNEAARDSIASVLTANNLVYDNLDRNAGDTSWVNWKTIFWDEPGALSTNQRTGIKKFIDQGNERSLILAGENVVYSHGLSGSTPDTSFLYNYLRVKPVSDDINGGNQTNQILGDGISPGSVSTLTSPSPDAMKPVNGAMVAARYAGFNSVDTVAGIYFNGPANVAVLGFGFNQVSEMGIESFLYGIPDWLNQIGGTLPVEISDFSGFWDGKSVQLSWKTSSETANAGFEIQVKTDAETTGEQSSNTSASWISVGFVKGAGTTQSTQNYDFTHNIKAKRGIITYRLRQIDLNGRILDGVPLLIEIGVPDQFLLLQNYPNPFNNSTTINFQLPVSRHVSLEIFNILGQRVRTLVNQPLLADYYSFSWDGSDDSGRMAASGQYFYRLSAGENRKVLRMVFLK
ncbi:MAG: T9SS type A sorting domain-containing protein [Bacteroidetes bacterium]|nr:T9SS type A sorting domain-containing protein [Bacteroidota bacterium]